MPTTKLSPKTIPIYYSPDSDDAFMFYALQHHKISSGPFQFEFYAEHTQKLNERVLKGEALISAVSIGLYPLIADRYRLLSHGGSVGRNYGPVLVCQPQDQERLKQAIAHKQPFKIAIPGENTTAFLVLKILLGDFPYQVAPIEPFSKVFDQIRNQDVDAGLVIHEGRLLYTSLGFCKLIDIGEAWFERTGLPLPLGGNVISRSLGDNIPQLSQILQQSIQYALEHQDEVVSFLEEMQIRSGSTNRLSKPQLQQYLGMYANQDTLTYDRESIKAIQLLFDEGLRIGHYAQKIPLDLA